jgi:hypothetical protein
LSLRPGVGVDIENLNKVGLSNRIASVRAAKVLVFELDSNES